MNLANGMLYAFPALAAMTFSFGDTLSEKLFRVLTIKKGRHHA